MFESQVTEAYSPFLTTTVVSRPLSCCLGHWCDLPVPVCIVDHNQRTLIAFFLFSIFFLLLAVAVVLEPDRVQDRGSLGSAPGAHFLQYGLLSLFQPVG